MGGLVIKTGENPLWGVSSTELPDGTTKQTGYVIPTLLQVSCIDCDLQKEMSNKTYRSVKDKELGLILNEVPSVMYLDNFIVKKCQLISHNKTFMVDSKKQYDYTYITSYRYLSPAFIWNVKMRPNQPDSYLFRNSFSWRLHVYIFEAEPNKLRMSKNES
jgi:hypothetical protein